MDAKMLIDVIENAGFDARSYSGRGMYGKECVGYTCDDPTDSMLDIIEDHEGDIAELIQTLRRMRTDNMGMSYICYFPNIKWPQE